jgi:hypothetical protein
MLEGRSSGLPLAGTDHWPRYRLPTEKPGDADLQPAQCLQQRGLSPLVRNKRGLANSPVIVNTTNRFGRERHIQALAKDKNLRS